MDLIKTIILAIVEGFSEFLPISSTGHMLMFTYFMDLKDQEELVNTFIIAVQFGAIFSIPLVFYKKFFSSIDFYIKLLVGFIPAGIIGYLLNDYIDRLIETPLVIAISMISVGVVLTLVDDWYYKNKNYVSRPITYKEAFVIGMFQCFALIPGVSRSASTIFGGLSQKLNWKQATEFSFFLAVPTLSAAALYKTYKHWDTLQAKRGMMEFLVLGNIISFIISVLTVTLFIRFVQKIGFRYFGIYRIIIGMIFLIFVMRGMA